MPLPVNFYDLLGIHKGATLEEIRRAYHNAAHKLHPDVNKNPAVSELFLHVKEAYEVLSNLKSREAYDKKLAAEGEEPVVTNVLFSQPSLAVLDEPQLVYVILDFLAEEKFATKSNPNLNICLVLDRSTSMQGSRMDTVKSAAIELINQIKPEDLLSVINFSDRAEILIPAGKHPDRQKVESQIHMMRAGGGTEIYQGLEAGFSEISRNSRKSMINHIILLTDGRTYGDENPCIQLADRAAAQGIRITGIGIGEEWNDVFLDEIGARTGGNSFYISRVSDLENFLREKINSLHQSFAERVILDLTIEPGVTLNSAFRLQPDSAILTSTLPIRLGNIPKTSILSILLEFIVQPISVDINWLKLASGELRYLLPSEPSTTQKTAININRMTSDSISIEPPPRRIFQALSQITFYRMQESARHEVVDGKVEEASLRLQRLAKHLLSSGEPDLAHTAIMEAERIKKTHKLSAEGEKRIKYGTRSFLLPSAIENGVGS
jgi:Ca-activated chloride channel family protein